MLYLPWIFTENQFWVQRDRALEEIERLRQANHELADVAEARGEEIERLRRENEESRSQEPEQG